MEVRKPQKGTALMVADTAFTRTTESWERAQRFVTKEVQEHPLRTLLLSLGAGYIVGGGLFSSLTSRVVGAGARVALRVVTLPVMLQGGMHLAEQMFASTPERSVEK